MVFWINIFKSDALIQLIARISSLQFYKIKINFDLYSKEHQKFLALNLAQFYSGTGRPAKKQAQILRSLVLFVLLFNKTPARTSPHLMDGFAMSFPIPFHLPSSAVFPLFLSFLLSALIMTSWTASGWLQGTVTPAILFFLTKKNGQGDRLWWETFWRLQSFQLHQDHCECHPAGQARCRKSQGYSSGDFFSLLSFLPWSID